MDELQKVMRQSGAILSEAHSDYNLHATLVGEAEKRERAARNLHKMLDRKYKRWIKMLSKCSDSAELAKQWRQAMDSGDTAGVFWAIMSHPRADSTLIRLTYEDVHMLSHIQGASNRADLKSMKALESKTAELRETLSGIQQSHKMQISAKEEHIRQLEQKVLLLMARSVRTEPHTQHSEQHDRTFKHNREFAKRVDWLEGQLAQRDMRLDELGEERAGLKELLHETREEHAAMEQALALMLDREDGDEKNRQKKIDLCGKRILYVGGRSTLTPHLRSLVEAHNGRFDHHDGGKEDNRAGLHCTLMGADMVFCPVDCISHDACRRVKRHCRQQAKQFIPLRSSGLSTFAAGLRRVSSAIEV
jgi:hypothetical protein